MKVLSGSLIRVKEQSEWPGTILRGDTAFVNYYWTNDEAKRIIKDVSTSLYFWTHPNLPEDLSFIKHGKPWLINTAHENQCSIETEDEHEITRIIGIRGLKIEQKTNFGPQIRKTN
jgi:hypothetical protein